MGKANNKRDIRERREKILLLLSRGYSQSDICEELGITRQNMSKDMKFKNLKELWTGPLMIPFIDEITQKGLN
jgi:transcriptional regulator with XRE-family HTH domain